MIVTNHLTVDSMVKEAMDGVPEMPTGITTGYRLISEEQFKFVLWKLRETYLAANGPQHSSFHST